MTIVLETDAHDVFLQLCACVFPCPILSLQVSTFLIEILERLWQALGTICDNLMFVKCTQELPCDLKINLPCPLSYDIGAELAL